MKCWWTHKSLAHISCPAEEAPYITHTHTHAVVTHVCSRPNLHIAPGWHTHMDMSNASPPPLPLWLSQHNHTQLIHTHTRVHTPTKQIDFRVKSFLLSLALLFSLLCSCTGGTEGETISCISLILRYFSMISFRFIRLCVSGFLGKLWFGGVSGWGACWRWTQRGLMLDSIEKEKNGRKFLNFVSFNVEIEIYSSRDRRKELCFWIKEMHSHSEPGFYVIISNAIFNIA